MPPIPHPTPPCLPLTPTAREGGLLQDCVRAGELVAGIIPDGKKWHVVLGCCGVPCGTWAYIPSAQKNKGLPPLL